MCNRSNAIVKRRKDRDVIPTLRGAELVIVPSAGETTRLLSLIGLRLGFSLLVKNWLREEYWWSSSSHSDLARAIESPALRREGGLCYLLHPVAEEKTQRMMNWSG